MDNVDYLGYVFAYKILCLASGIISIFLGYKLFIKGIIKSAGTLEGSVGDKTISLKNGAPGIFFSLFGAVIICYVIFSGLKVESQKESNQGNYPISSDIYIVESFNNNDSILINNINDKLEKSRYITDENPYSKDNVTIAGVLPFERTKFDSILKAKHDSVLKYRIKGYTDK